MAAERGGRGADGRFVAGVSGNPKGRPKGSLNRRTLLLRGMQEGEDLAAVRNVWAAATGGRDTVTARWVIGALAPPAKADLVPFDVPDDPRDLPAAWYAVLGQLADGLISGAEALARGRFLATRSQVFSEVPDWEEVYEHADDEEEAENEMETTMTEEARLIFTAPVIAPEAAPPEKAPPPLAGEDGWDEPTSEAPVGGDPPTPPPPQAGEGQRAELEEPVLGAAPSPQPVPRKGSEEERGDAATVETAEEAFRRRDGLWRAGLLGGRELLDHVEEKRRRGQHVNGLQRGFRTILVPRRRLEPAEDL